MSAPILTTKLYIPRPRPKFVSRPRLVRRLDEGLDHKLSLISAPAGFGKTTLVGEWAAAGQRPFAWLSLDEGDNDPARFLAYLVAALQGIRPGLGLAAPAMLQSPQPPPFEAVLAGLVNDIDAQTAEFCLVLDDYHLIEAPAVDQCLAFLLEKLPPQMHLVIITREDPTLPLPRLRVRGQMTELRAADLRFTLDEAAEFLNRAMGLSLSAENIAALENRTEGWIAGLQLAAISMQGHKENAAAFIHSFTGSHRFVLDYLLEEVLQQQPQAVQSFLLRTAVLDRLCGPLCDAVAPGPAASGQETLEALDRANLFLVPLDSERRWYRYHHLFADLLRQRLLQRTAAEIAAAPIETLHIRASQWFEENGLELEAFHHAAAAQDIDRAGRLLQGGGMPLHFRGAVGPVLGWLASLPAAELDTRPVLWVMYASALSMSGRLVETEEKLQSAETAVNQTIPPGAEPDAYARNLIGHIAALRALLAAARHDAEAIIAQSNRALEYLHPDNLPVRTATTWKLGIAYHLRGQRQAAAQAYGEAVAASQASGNVMINMMASTGLAQVQELENKLHQAAETYGRILRLAGEPTPPAARDSLLGLARIHYQWNELETAEDYGRLGLELARPVENIDTPAACAILLARLKLAQGEPETSAELLAEAEQLARAHHFERLMGEITAVRVLGLLRQGNHEAAAQLAQSRPLPTSQARVLLAQGDAVGALALLEPSLKEAETAGLADERLRLLALSAVVLQAGGQSEAAQKRLAAALALAEPGGFIRLFLDEGPPMAHLLAEAAVRGMMPTYTGQLLDAFHPPPSTIHPPPSTIQPLVEPLSERELEVLQLIAQGLSNREIGQRLFLALDTVKGHNRRIFDKLQVKRRTEAVAKANALRILREDFKNE